MKHESMSNVDAAWYHMEEPTNLMMVTGFMYFKEPITREAVQDVLEKRLVPFNRFRQRVVQDDGPLKSPSWQELAPVDFQYHLLEETLPEPGTHEQLKQRAGDLMSLSLDFSKPLWQAHLVHNCDGGNAIILRIHHCIADGIALIGVLLSMTAATAEESINLGPLPEDEPHRLQSQGQLFKLAENAINVAGKATARIFDTVTSPSKLLNFAKMGTAGAVTAAKLVMKSSDPETVFRGNLTIAKKATWSHPISLEDIKRIKNVTGTTVNDVLLTAMTGGLRRYLEGRSQKTGGLSFRAVVPVNLRDPRKFKELGNQFGLVFLDLPVGVRDPLDRLFALKKNMDAIKSSPEAVVAFGILKAVGTTPSEIQKLVVNIFGTKGTCIMTNVPGPKDPLYFGGKKMDHMMFWVPRSGNVGLGISILSYAGEVRLGVATDAGLVPDPEKIVEGFHAELEEMLKLATQVGQ